MDFDELFDDPLVRSLCVEGIEEEEHLKVKFWLLDSAIEKFSSVKLFRKKQYLPDVVFSRPGMSEEEMVTYLTLRGATKTCVQYARRKFRETNFNGIFGSVDSDSDGVTSVCADADGDGSGSRYYPEVGAIGTSVSSAATDRSSYFRKSWKRMKKLFG